MKYFKYPFCSKIESLHPLTFLSLAKGKLFLVVLILFTLVLPGFAYSTTNFSICSVNNEKIKKLNLQNTTSHNKQKMCARVADFLDSHDDIESLMKEKAIQKIIDFSQDFKISPANEAKTLRHLFFTVQETFLKEYVLYASFFQTIENGKYDCLTASLLYAIFLEEIKQKGNFEYTYKLIQLPTHVFIKIELTNKSEIIFESTSFEKGFIATPKAIEFYLEKQTQEAQTNLQNTTTLFIINQNSNNLLTLDDATALLYFNQAVLFFDQRKFGKTLKMAKKALYLQKNETFYTLIQLSLQELLKNNSITEKEYKINSGNFIFVSN